jgi:hypothetical protein
MSRDQLDSLLDEACSLACYFLEKNREFFPFAVAMGKEGEIRHIQGFTGVEQPTSPEVLKLLEAGLRAEAQDGSIVACAVVKDIRLTPVSTNVSTEAVAVALEHHADEPVMCFLPYSFDGSVLLTGEIIAQRGERKIFSTSAA